jgi:hypothetical protein
MAWTIGTAAIVLRDTFKTCTQERLVEAAKKCAEGRVSGCPVTTLQWYVFFPRLSSGRGRTVE